MSFHTIRTLGEGVFGAVELGHRDGRLVARKRFRGPGARYEAMAQRRARAALGDVVPDVLEVEDDFIDMEPARGHNLRSLGLLHSDQVRRVAVQLATLVERLHRAGIVIRDLKAQHVFVDAEFKVVAIVDWGCALIDGEPDPFPEAPAPNVAPPIFLPGEEFDPKAGEMRAVGALLYGLLSPLPDAPILRSPKVDSGDPELDGAIAACLAKAQGARPTARQLRERLGGLAPVSRGPGVVSADPEGSGMIAPRSAVRPHSAPVDLAGGPRFGEIAAIIGLVLMSAAGVVSVLVVIVLVVALASRADNDVAMVPPLVAEPPPPVPVAEEPSFSDGADTTPDPEQVTESGAQLAEPQAQTSRRPTFPATAAEAQPAPEPSSVCPPGDVACLKLLRLHAWGKPK